MAANTGALAAIFVTSVVNEAVRRGASRGALLAASGMPEDVLLHPEAPVPLSAVLNVWEAAMRLLHDDGFPVAVARTFTLDHYPVLGFAIMTAASGREAIARMVRFTSLVSTTGRWTTEERDEVLRVRWHREGARTLGQRVANESVLAELLQGLQQLFGAELHAWSVSFRHPAPRDVRAHKSHFGGNITWNAEEDGLSLPRSLLTRVPRLANPAMAAHFEQQAVNLLREARSSETMTEKARSALAIALPSGAPSAVQIAKRLGLSERTLRRTLAAEGATFREVLETLRQDRARLLLGDPRTSVAEVALTLGFSELSAFSRAHKRWTGKAPSEVRG
jgi:AraC-like DNA-binding protein